MFSGLFMWGVGSGEITYLAGDAIVFRVVSLVTLRPNIVELEAWTCHRSRSFAWDRCSNPQPVDFNIKGLQPRERPSREAPKPHDVRLAPTRGPIARRGELTSPDVGA